MARTRSALRVCSATFGDGPYQTRVQYLQSGGALRVGECHVDVCAILRAKGNGVAVPSMIISAMISAIISAMIYGSSAPKVTA